MHGLCPVESTDTTWTAESMANNQVATYFQNRTTLQLSCPGQEPSNSYVKGNQLITIPTNCSLLGNDLRVDSHSDVLLEAPTTTYPFWNSSKFLRGWETSQGITDTRAALKHSSIRPAANIEDLLGQDQHLREAIMHREQGARMITLFYLLLAFNILVILAILGNCGYLWRHQQKSPTSTSPSDDVVLARINPCPDSTTT